MNPFAELENPKSQSEDRRNPELRWQPARGLAPSGLPKPLTRRDTLPHIAYRQD